MSEYRIEMQGYEKTVEGMDKCTKALDKKLREVVKETARKIERKQKELAPMDMGQLRASIRAEYSGDGLSAEIGPEDTVQARTMEFGRKPGSKMPPPELLAGWAKRHGMEGAEYVIARSIAKKGIRPKRFIQLSGDAYLGEFVEDIANAVAEASSEVKQ